MHNYKLVIEYDGYSFNGWQKQKYTSNTIQEQIESAIKKILNKDLKLIVAGRTDAGVSAYNQVANFKCDEISDTGKFIYSLNSILPGSITVKRISKTGINFHSRFDAIRREYIYKITTRKKSIGSKEFFRINFKPDFSQVDSFISYIMGVRSFKSFCKNKTDKHNFRCDIFDFDYKIKKSANEIIFRISAGRFLHSMVRCIIGCALEIGRKKIQLDTIIEKVKKGEKVSVYYLPANALFLNKIYYRT